MKKNKAEELDLQEAPQQEAPRQEAPQQEQMALDDARRVKVLSPGMLVFKRFIRNKLAVVGIIILAVMFLFSFLGPVFSPYEIDQIFTKESEELGKYATGKFNADPRFVGDASSAMQTGVMKALSETKKGGVYSLKTGQEISFSAKNDQYNMVVLNPDKHAPSVAIYGTKHIATIVKGELQFYDNTVVDSGLLELLREHSDSNSKEKELTYNGMTISAEITKVERKYFIPSDEPVALASYNIFTSVNGDVVDLQADAEFLQTVSAAVMNGESSVTYNGGTYTISQNGTDRVLNGPDGSTLFNIVRDNRFGTVKVETTDKDGKRVETAVDFVTTIDSKDEFLSLLDTAIQNGEQSFDYGDKAYSIAKTETDFRVTNADNELILTVVNSFVPVETKYDSITSDLNFCFELETAMAKNASSFQYNGERFLLVSDGEDYIVQNGQGKDILLVSDIAYGADYVGIELTFDFVRKLSDAIRTKKTGFTFVDQYGHVTEASVNVSNNNYYVSTLQKTSLLDQRSGLSSEHKLGTDINGMDVLTRLMHGGRISLIVGFVVVFFEIILGVIIGGISGYFGKVVDTILMRFVELFNAIPFYPMLIIVGSVMDQQKVDATPRLILTMAMMGILGWTGIARVVRGQILSLREQDFMIAAEATGIRTSRRIFRHLVPNVMPLLIVNATSSLGSVILTEATLGFLGLGVKYPMASWGSIINQVNDMQVMRTAWWIWIPAGLFIMITVLGFNFVGDGLRDAFDPKMKR
jgi:peptide/nickel transport system permease protein